MRLRFTIRDLLWLTLVVALAFGLALGWSIDHNRMAEDNANILQAADSQLKMMGRALEALNARETIHSPDSQQEPEPPVDNMPILHPRRRIQPMPNSVEHNEPK